MKKYLLIAIAFSLIPFFLTSQNSKQMSYVKMNGDKVELRTATGSYTRTITDHAVSAQLNTNGDLVVVVKTDGKVELRKEGGSYVCTITDNAKDARFLGGDILITKKDGKMELRKQSGAYIRQM